VRSLHGCRLAADASLRHRIRKIPKTPYGKDMPAGIGNAATVREWNDPCSGTATDAIRAFPEARPRLLQSCNAFQSREPRGGFLGRSPGRRAVLAALSANSKSAKSSQLEEQAFS
jgi:hypothetical protein